MENSNKEIEADIRPTKTNTEDLQNSFTGIKNSNVSTNTAVETSTHFEGSKNASNPNVNSTSITDLHFKTNQKQVSSQNKLYVYIIAGLSAIIVISVLITVVKK